MKSSCDGELLASWAAGGAGAQPDAPLLDHLDECGACAEEHAAIVEARAALLAIPVRPIARERIDAIRFRVVAAARRHAGAPAPRQPAAAAPRPARRSALAAVAAAVALAAVLALVLWPRGKGRAAAVELVADAQGQLVRPGPDEAFALLDGQARFEVRKLALDETFRVLVGGDTVEVRGTRFEVVAAAGRIAAVSVSEGAVLLTVAEGWSRELVAGDSWERPSSIPVEASDAPRAAPAAASLAATGPAPAAAGAPAAATPTAAQDSMASSSAPAVRAVAAASSADAAAAFDARFQLARAALQAGNAAAAAMSFDALAANTSVDAGRRNDALYWAAYAHARAGNAAEAEKRARGVAEAPTPSWHADDAALLLGESLLDKGDRAAARPWLEQAARSRREAVRARARAALAALEAPR